MKEDQINLGDKFTIVTDSRLSNGYKVVQSAHALADFAVKYPLKFKAWQLGSNYLCCLEYKNLERIIDRLKDHNVLYKVFREPDIDNQITAIAVECLDSTTHKKLFKNLKLTCYDN